MEWIARSAGPGASKRAVLASRWLARSGDLAAAEELLAEVEGGSAELRYRRAWVIAKLGRQSEALGLLEDLLSASPENTGARLLAARLHLQQGDRFAAYLAAEGLLTHPEAGSLELTVARYAELAGDEHEAARLLSSAEARGSVDGDTALRLARALRRATCLPAYEVLRRAELAAGNPTQERDALEALVDLLSASPAGAARALVRLRELAPQLAREVEIATRLTEAGLAPAAARAWEAILAGEASPPVPWLKSFVEALRKLPRNEVRYRSIVGLTSTAVGQLDRALPILEAASSVESTDRPQKLALLGRTRLDLQDVLGAAVALREACASSGAEPEWFHLLGQCYQNPRIADFPAALECYASALKLDPSSTSIAVRTHGVAARLQDWALVDVATSARCQAERNRLPRRAWALSRLESATTTLIRSEVVDPDEAVQIIRSSLVALDDVGIVSDVVDAAVRKLLVEGHFVEAFALRRLLASRMVTDFRSKFVRRSMRRIRESVAAAAYMGDLGVGADLLDASTPALARAAGIGAKLRADLSLAEATFGQFWSYSDRQRDRYPMPGDETFASLIEGKSIALVGPSEIAEYQGEEIDSHDTVVRIRFQPDFVRAHRRALGRRTDISYFSGRDFVALRDEFEPSIRAGELQQVVARAMMFGVGDSPGNYPDWLRFTRSEYSLYFRSTALGIQRAIYDILQFRPSRITLYNVDFYSGATKFTQGYRPDVDSHMTAGSLLADVFASHDLVADFQFTRRLFDSGVLRGDSRAHEILSLSDGRYIELLAAGGRF